MITMPDATLAIRQKTEAMIKAYLQSKIAAAAPSAMDGVDLRLRQEVTTRAFPRCVIECPRASEDDDTKTTGVYQVELMILTGTQADETNAAAQHAKRVGLISEWINSSEAAKAALMAFCNPPSPGPDNRAVKGFYLYDIQPGQEDGDQTGQHWIDRLVITLIAQLQDE